MSGMKHFRDDRQHHDVKIKKHQSVKAICTMDPLSSPPPPLHLPQPPNAARLSM